MYRRAHRSAYRKKKKKEQSIDYAGWKSDTGQSRGNHRRNKDERSSERKIIEIKREKGNLLSRARLFQSWSAIRFSVLLLVYNATGSLDQKSIKNPAVRTTYTRSA